MTIRELIAEAKAQEYVTTEQLALLLNVSVKTVRRAVRSGKVPALRVTTQLRIHRETALRVLAQGRSEGTGADNSARAHPAA